MNAIAQVAAAILRIFKAIRDAIFFRTNTANRKAIEDAKTPEENANALRKMRDLIFPPRN